MPTYDYLCDGCGHEMELFQRITEDAIKKCPECKKNKLRRLFGTGAAVVFKGSGFYQTDYRSDSYKKGEKAAGKDGSKKDANKAGKESSAKDSGASTKSDGGSSTPSSESKSSSTPSKKND